MEALIHLQAFHRGYKVPPGEAYAVVEAPKGEFSVYLVADGPTSPTAAAIQRAGLPIFRRSSSCRRVTSSPTVGEHRSADVCSAKSTPGVQSWR